MNNTIFNGSKIINVLFVALVKKSMQIYINKILSNNYKQ